MNQITMIPVKKIYPHPHNPRKTIGDVSELADSIKKNGVLQNLTVVKGHYTKNGFEDDAFTAVIGHRRLLAARQAGLEEVPCVIKEMDYKEQIQTMLLENIQRSDLTVYEQAQGFQMMMDLGSSIEDISEKTGFSETTVRRRIKMMELDQNVLKEVSGRQLNLADFDRLAQIKDIEKRNEVLEKIGTNDFNQTVARALNLQASAENKSVVLKWLKEHNAKEISQSDSWSNKYERIIYINLADLGKQGDWLPDDLKEGKPLFYVFDNFSVRIYQKAKKPAAVKRSPEELEKERAEKQAAEEYERLTRELYGLRKAFIDSKTPTGSIREWVYLYAMRASVLKCFTYSSSDSKSLREIFGLKEGVYDPDAEAKVLKAFPDLRLSQEFKCTVALFGDSERNNCSSRYSGFPEYKKNYMLELFYEFLDAIGYEISTEEQAYLDGSHVLYGRGRPT